MLVRPVAVNYTMSQKKGAEFTEFTEFTDASMPSQTILA